MDSFMLINSNIQNKLAVLDILKCNEYTARFNLALTAVEAKELATTRDNALLRNGRIEFGGGIVDKLIKEFCDSPFIHQGNYAIVMHDLIETFYYFKNESLDSLSDDELISLMKKYFDHECQGCVELLQNRELEAIARNIRYGNRKINSVYTPDGEEDD